MTDKEQIKCKYKFQDKEKFDGKTYCTCFCELCEDLPPCDDNCQIFEDYKELVHYKRTLKEINNLIFPDIKDARITPIAITEIRERLYQSLKLPENNKNTAIMRNIYECIKNSFCKYCGIYICKGCLYFDIKKAIKKEFAKQEVKKMTDKEQIIIDGVDVSECVSFDKLNGQNICCYEDTREDKIPFANFCVENKDCYFKQLIRKTQECEALKSESFTMNSLIIEQEEEIDRYRKVLEKIEECINNLKKQDILTFPDFSLQENCKVIMKQCNEGYRQILNIINKAKGKYD